MISIEEANKKAIMCSNKSMCCEGLVKEIYDSIGSCSECKHMEVIDSGAGIISCTRATFDPIEPDFFCADFERKGDK